MPTSVYSSPSTPTPSSKAFTKLHAIRWTLYALMAITLIVSVVTIPWWVDVGRDLWPSGQEVGPARGPAGPTVNPWIYSIVAAAECCHLLLLFFGLSAAYDESSSKSIAYAIITALITISLFTICCYVHVIVVIVCQLALSVAFAFYAREICRERNDVCFGGRNTPLI